MINRCTVCSCRRRFKRQQREAIFLGWHVMATNLSSHGGAIGPTIEDGFYELVETLFANHIRERTEEP